MARITVEDCLEHEPNRFALVQLAAKRAKQLLGGSPAAINDQKGHKPVVLSLREIAAKKVRFMTEEEMLVAEAKRKEEAAQQAAAASAMMPLPTLESAPPNGGSAIDEANALFANVADDLGDDDEDDDDDESEDEDGKKKEKKGDTSDAEE